MPKLGLTMASGTIARWMKRPGDAVREGEPLVEVSTDKITYEVESPASGTVGRALGNDGDEFACGDVIGRNGARRGSAAHLCRGERRDADGVRLTADRVARRAAARARTRFVAGRRARHGPARPHHDVRRSASAG
jgi:pyruvate/2-oxoglutarate dehydrogenase complex dihydrolipoamide acyltransferase (E2) component